MIHFDELPTAPPTTSNFPLLPAGRYYAEIEKAEMRKAKTSGEEYLNIQFRCYNGDGLEGRVFDRLFDSDKPLLKYKLAQFLRAMPNTFSGSFKLSDLPKLVQGKTIIVQIKVRTQEGYADTNEVDVFDDDIYSRVTQESTATESTVFDPEKEDY